MNLFLKAVIILTFISTQSCNSSKSSATSQTKQNEQSKLMEQELTAKGYNKGTLTAQKNSECTYILVDEKTGAKFDPINLEEDKFGDFKDSENETVYYKFRPLRRMNRCPEAQPISIEDIKKGSN